MKVFYIRLADKSVMHGKCFTTEKLAQGYLSEDTTCNYKFGRWTDKETGELVAEIAALTLHVE